MCCPVLAQFAGYAKPTRFLAVRGLCLLATGLVALAPRQCQPSSLALLLAATVAAVSRSGVPTTHGSMRGTADAQRPGWKRRELADRERIGSRRSGRRSVAGRWRSPGGGQRSLPGIR